MGVGANGGTQDGNKDGRGDEAEMRTGMGVETRGRTQYGNGDGSGDGNESSRVDGNGDENEIRKGEGEAKKRKKSHKRCRSDVGNGKTWVERRGGNVDKKWLVQ